jgi:hypothetical protein
MRVKPNILASPEKRLLLAHMPKCSQISRLLFLPRNLAVARKAQRRNRIAVNGNEGKFLY